MSESIITDGAMRRELPTVGRYRRGSRLRTTKSGTWFPATDPRGTVAGLLLVHPAIDAGDLRSTLTRLTDGGVPGIPAVQDDPIHQAGRNWLAIASAIIPTLTELTRVESPEVRDVLLPVLHDVALTLSGAHAAGVVHGSMSGDAVLVGADGCALVAEWCTGLADQAGDDILAWSQMVQEVTGDRFIQAPVTTTAEFIQAQDRLAHAIDDSSRERLVEMVTERLAVLRQNQPLLFQPAPESDTEVVPVTPTRTSAVDAAPRWAPQAPLGPAPAPVERWADEPRSETNSAIHEPGNRPGWGFGPVIGKLVAAAALFMLGLCCAFLAPPSLFPALRDLHSPPIVMPSEPTHAVGPLAIDKVELQEQNVQGVCSLVGTIITNGQPGDILYRWTGDTVNQPAMFTSASLGSEQVNLGLVWLEGQQPDTPVTLQILKPRQLSATSRVSTQCE